MPAFEITRCNSCGFGFPGGWGGNTYVTDDSGKRIHCPHPGEAPFIMDVTGLDWIAAGEAGRTGFASYFICFDCCAQFELDHKRDFKLCPQCASENVKSTHGSLACTCPKCKKGTFVQEPTGLMC